MSQQGGTPTGHEDDWWAQLYDDSTEDTGPAPAADSLDDRFASAAGAVRADSADPPGGHADSADRPGGHADSADPPGGADRETAGGPERAAAGSPDPAAAAGGADRAAAGEAPSVPAPRTERAGTADEADWWAPETAQPPPPPSPLPPAPPRAPWQPPPDRPPAPTTFPPGPLPPGFDERARRSQGPERGEHPPRETARAVPAPSPLAPTASALGTATPFGASASPPDAERIAPAPDRPPAAQPHVGSGPPTYDAEPTALPAADPDALDDLVPDTVLDGARYGACTLRAASVRGDSARYRGEPRRDCLLTARFGAGEQTLVLVAMATGARATPGAHRAAAEACRWIARAVGRSHLRLGEDIRAGRRGDLKSGLHRLTDRSLGRLRAGAAEQGLEPEEYAATLRCLLLPADPACRVRVFFGVGPGGLFRLRGGEWQDIEPGAGEVTGEPVVGFGSPPAETPEGDRLTMDLAIPTPPNPYDPDPGPPREPFRFRASLARPGDTLLMCTEGLAEPLRGEPELPAHLTQRWSGPTPPGLAAFLADTLIRVKGYADDRTAAAVWEA